MGVVIQLGGQTPLRLARGLEAAGVPILGTSPEAIDLAEDRGRFDAIVRELGVLKSPFTFPSLHHPTSSFTLLPHFDLHTPQEYIYFFF